VKVRDENRDVVFVLLTFRTVLVCELTYSAERKKVAPAAPLVALADGGFPCEMAVPVSPFASVPTANWEKL